MRYQGFIAVLCVGMVAAIGLTQEKADSVEGKWERRQKGEGDKLFRLVKEHKGGRTTLTMYDDKGAVVIQHTSQYKLRKAEEVRVFTFSNIEITAGPGKGRKSAGPASYAYRIRDDTFYEVWGVLLDDARPPEILVWTRVKEK